VSSRQEEKEQRKRERLERERIAEQSARRRRLQITGGVVVATAVVVAAVLAIAGGGGGGASQPTTPQADQVPIPARKITSLEAAAKAAHCALTNPPIEGNNHVTTKVTYKTNPPTSGDHAPPGQQASDGSYVGLQAPAPERYVHSLEHGRIIIQYKPGLAKRRIGQLETLFLESTKTDFGLDSTNGGFTLIMQNNTKMPEEVAATAWGHLLSCATFNDRVFDAIRAFRQRYVLQGPEKITEQE
jgi:hypothetical protein